MWKTEEQHEAFIWLLNRKLRSFYEWKQQVKTRKDITMKRAIEYSNKRKGIE